MSKCGRQPDDREARAALARASEVLGGVYLLELDAPILELGGEAAAKLAANARRDPRRV